MAKGTTQKSHFYTTPGANVTCTPRARPRLVHCSPLASLTFKQCDQSTHSPTARATRSLRKLWLGLYQSGSNQVLYALYPHQTTDPIQATLLALPSQKTYQHTPAIGCGQWPAALITAPPSFPTPLWLAVAWAPQLVSPETGWPIPLGSYPPGAFVFWPTYHAPTSYMRA